MYYNFFEPGTLTDSVTNFFTQAFIEKKETFCYGRFIVSSYFSFSFAILRFGIMRTKNRYGIVDETLQVSLI